MKSTRIDPVAATFTQPGARRDILRTLAAVAGLAATAGPAHARTRKVTKRRRYEQLLCTVYDDPCDSAFDWQLRTRGTFVLAFAADDGNCTPMRVRFQVDGEPFGAPDGYVVAPGQGTGPVSEGRSPRPNRAVRLLVEQALGGSCPSDPYVLFRWSGTLRATVSARRR